MRFHKLKQSRSTWGIRWVQLFFVGCWPEVMLSTSSLGCARSGRASSKADPRTMYTSFRDADASYVVLIAFVSIFFDSYINFVFWYIIYWIIAILHKAWEQGAEGEHQASTSQTISDPSDRLREHPEQYVYTHATAFHFAMSDKDVRSTLQDMTDKETFCLNHVYWNCSSLAKQVFVAVGISPLLLAHMSPRPLLFLHTSLRNCWNTFYLANTVGYLTFPNFPPHADTVCVMCTNQKQGQRIHSYSQGNQER